MTKYLLSGALAVAFLTSTAQTEPYFKAMKALKINSTKLESFMMLKGDYPHFVPCNGDAMVVGEYPNPDKDGETFKVEAFHFVYEKDGAVIQMLFANDRLYAKNVMWYYGKDQVKEVKQKYAAMNNNLHANQYLLHVEGGRVISKEAKTESGDITAYPIQTRGMDYMEANVGFESVYMGETPNMESNDGYWVYVEVFNSFDNPVHLGMTIPTFYHPHVALGNICGAFAQTPAEVEEVAPAAEEMPATEEMAEEPAMEDAPVKAAPVDEKAQEKAAPAPKEEKKK